MLRFKLASILNFSDFLRNLRPHTIDGVVSVLQLCAKYFEKYQEIKQS